ncbi:MAG TPA: GAF domain-containing protein [Candidatus Limnocylindria bacterium]
MTRAPMRPEPSTLPGADSTGARELLARAVEEAARLLEADGAIVYLVDRDEKRLRFAVGAGIRDPEAQQLIRDLALPVGVGLFGHSVAVGEVVVTGDYPKDERFSHSPIADRIVTLTGIRTMAAAPLMADGEVLGALGAYSTREDDFSEADVTLLRALADHAAGAIANQRLIGRLAESEAELARRVEAQRTLGEMATQLTSLREPSAVLEHALRAAVRLLDGDGGQIGTVAPDAEGQLRWLDGHSQVHESLVPFTKEDQTPVEHGVSGRALREGRPSWTDDYIPDTDFPHDEASDRVARELGIRAVIAAPLVVESGPMGAIGVYAERADAFDADDAELLGLLADQVAIVLTNARLNAEAALAAEELERRVEAQRSVGEIAARITAIRDPDDVLQRTLDEAVRLLHADGGRIELVAESGGLHWAFGHSAIDLPIERDEEVDPVVLNEGVSGRAVLERRVVRSGDYLADETFRHAAAPDLYIRQHGIRSVMSAPLIGEDGAIGSITVHSQARDAFTEADAELLEVLASQAAIAVTNARLYEAVRQRADAQRSLAVIASEIASLRDPVTVLQRAVADAARLLRADRAQVNLAREGADVLDPPIASAPSPPSPEDVVVPIGSGIAGLAAAECRVYWTGDYLADSSFPHDEGDERIREQGIRSMMAAPLREADRLTGTITVQSVQPNAFDADDAELLSLLADQAAIALTNARLYAQLGESERRYRHLVDYSPDIVWSVDAEGRFTFLSDSLESRTGWKADELMGKPFTVLADRGSIEGAEAAWAALIANPQEEQTVRLDLPLANGEVSQAEVAMAATVVDGKFAGAHGSVRDISERERLEGDLRLQAAELAASQERAHLARELHDSVTQALFSMGLTLRSLELLLETDAAAAAGKVAELRELQKDALAEMRTLIFELRPASLETDGLVRALRTHATAVQRRTGLALVVDAEAIPRLPLATEEALYRIGQEAIHNIVKHANASRASVRVAQDGDLVRLTVTDDGAGFSPGDVPRGHLGLLGMRQRLDLTGGELRVESAPGRGTTIEASVPNSGDSAD